MTNVTTPTIEWAQRKVVSGSSVGWYDGMVKGEYCACVLLRLDGWFWRSLSGRPHGPYATAADAMHAAEMALSGEGRGDE